MSRGFIRECPGCHSTNLDLDNETQAFSPEGDIIYWRRVRCTDCKKNWQVRVQVKWEEERVSNQPVVLKCSQCDYIQQVPISQVLNYIALHTNNTGHTGLNFASQ